MKKVVIRVKKNTNGRFIYRMIIPLESESYDNINDLFNAWRNTYLPFNLAILYGAKF